MVFAGTLEPVYLELRDRVACHPIPVSGEPVLRVLEDPAVFSKQPRPLIPGVSRRRNTYTVKSIQ
ncbi:hypothetical protein DKAM_0483 [Desulfurococcus amylolyticus 1221n]|uniref:Uncharacterized protein n=1 Tax=Desulfurococcus amylolyticus (strain DSM 18924 / JCM 16383 / VKM B-2413 / 1221n) TaxID=490899 RepID=B8D3X8_DESA1|nr:hypothetical protein DKAM_0483 [Desulfurococcus amylolyticus 1221n]